MRTDLIKIKKLESKKELDLLKEGDVVMISVGSGKINDFKEYQGLAVFIGERLKETKDHGFDFCRPQARCLPGCFVGYHLKRESIIIAGDGVISSDDFFTYGTKCPNLVNLI